MKIDGRWHIEDEVSGLRITVIEGQALDKMSIEFIGAPIVGNREFWFTKDGAFDGTGSCMLPPRDEDAPPGAPK